MSVEITVDVGGTFTDLVLQDEVGCVRAFKAPSTAGRIVDGILDGLELVAADLRMTRAALLKSCRKVSCGTTVATNAILEATYAPTGLICTEGFRDTLLIREGGKDDTYTIAIDYPKPYIPRQLTFGVRERVNSEGGIETPLDEANVVEVLQSLKDLRVEAIAVSLIWSIANATHEKMIGALIEQHCPGLPYSLSHKASPIVREYRRTSATAIDASLKPLARRAVTELESRLREAGLTGLLTLVTSSGGQTSGKEVIERPIHLCLSGPSAAPESARHTIRQEQEKTCNAIVIDMGGTSFDISVVDDWDIPMHREGTIAGHVFGVPSVAVKTIGAGGGSIARVDAGGFVHVGPESARSRPGPACYGRGGTRPTVTDANLLRGFLDLSGFAGGTMVLMPDLAAIAMREHVAAPLGLSIEEAASLVDLTVEQNMVAAIEEITIRQGVDPRDYVMVAGGAAAGLHAVPIARELGIKRVLVPPFAGVLSAFGILVGDIKSSFSRSLAATTARFDFGAVNQLLAELEAEADAYLDRMNTPPDARIIDFWVEARYQGQVWQLSLRLQSSRIGDAEALARVVEEFHKLHERRYFVRSGDPVEFTEWTVIATGKLPETALNHGVKATRVPNDGRKGERTVYMRELGGSVSLPVFNGALLFPGQRIAGPALIDQRLTTIVLYPASTATFSATGSVWIDLG